ncbi:hypothetical protein [Corallibacter sp.]|uniref:hypothetical protein n=1 Tax=Corallibacter sp. TaxID=2038084 RepID=UPI003A91739A
MNNTKKHIGALLLALVYSFTIAATNHVPYEYVKKASDSVKEEAYSTYVSNVNYTHTVQGEFSVDTPEPLSLFNTDNFIAIHCVVNNQYNDLQDIKYKQYANSGKSFFIHQRKATLIFPFHYHW